MKILVFLCAALCTGVSLLATPGGRQVIHPALAEITPNYPVIYKEGHLGGIEGPIRLVLPHYLTSWDCRYDALVSLSIQETLDQRGFEMSGFSAFGAMIQSERGSEILSKLTGYEPYMPFFQPIRCLPEEGDDLDKLGFIGSFIKENPDKSFQVALYHQLWDLDSPEHVWLIFHRKARSDDPIKSFSDVKFAISPQKVADFKSLLPLLDERVFRKHGHPFSFWFDRLKGHPLAVYFADLMRALPGNMSDSYSKRYSTILLNENEDQPMALFRKACLTHQGKILALENGEPNFELASELFGRAMHVEKNPRTLGEYALHLTKVIEGIKNTDSEDHKAKEKLRFLIAYEAAVNGSAKAQKLLGNLYMYEEIPEDFKTTTQEHFHIGAKFLFQAESQGFFLAKADLADAYTDGKIGRTLDGALNYEEMGKRFYELAQEGLAKYQYNYAVANEAGFINKELSQDEREKIAAEWFWRAGQQKMSATYYESFINLYRHNPTVAAHVSTHTNPTLRVRENLDADVPWLFSIWQEQSNLHARRVLFLLYREGKITEPFFIRVLYEQAKEARDKGDFKKAFYIFLLHAVYFDNPNAMHNIGMILYKKDDLISAEQWFSVAANHGLAASKRNLARIADEKTRKTIPPVMRLYLKKEGCGLSFNNAGFALCDGGVLEVYKDKSDFEILQDITLSKNPGVLLSYDGLQGINLTQLY